MGGRARPGWMGGWMDMPPAVNWVSGHVNVWDTGSVLPSMGGGTVGCAGFGNTADIRGSGQLTDSGSCPDL